MKFDVIVSDPCWSFSDKLTMSSVKRGASANYKVLKDDDIANLSVQDIASDNAVLCLWVPSSKIELGLETMRKHGFAQKQTWIWVKVKKDPFKELKPKYKMKSRSVGLSMQTYHDHILGMINDFNLNSTLDFGMGRLFRQTHEIVLVGTRGKVYKELKNKSQRSVYFWSVSRHSEKPEGLQDMLDIMFPSARRLELFARRDRPGWTCVGLECPSTKDEDIRDSIKRLSNL